VRCETFSIDESWLEGKPHQPSKRMARQVTTLAEGEKELIEAALTESHGRISGPSGARRGSAFAPDARVENQSPAPSTGSRFGHS